MFLAITYSVLILGGLFFIAFRNETSLLQGNLFFKFNFVFLFISVFILLLGKAPTEDKLVSVVIVCITAISFLMRNNWFLFIYSPTKASTIVEDSFSRVLLPFQKIESGYILKSGVDEKTQLKLASFWPKCAIIIFRGDWNIRKVAVLKNLLKKKFSGVFPKIVIKLK